MSHVIIALVILQPTLLTANALISAARTGNLNAVKRALGTIADIDINAADAMGHTALHHAAIRGDLDIAEYLLANQADSRKTNTNGKVPFQLVIEAKMTVKRAKLASVLLHATKGVHGRDTKGWTALHWAILAKDRQLIDRWLNDGATLLRYGPMIRRQHPIEIAFLTQDQRLIDYLLDRYEEWRGNLALSSAVNSSIYELVVALLQRGYDPTSGNVNNSTLTRLAVNRGNAKILELLLKHGAPVNDSFPLIEAARRKRPELMKLLIDYGTEIKTSFHHDWYSLFTVSFRSGDRDLFAKVLTASLANNRHLKLLPAIARYSSGSKPNSEFIEVIDALLEHDFDINSRDAAEHTPLYHAIKNRNAYMVNALISRGADIEMRDAAGNTPLMLAVIVGESAVVKELLNNDADVHATLVDDATIDALSLARQALQREERERHKSQLLSHYRRITELLERRQRL